jgi:hypothetical protein
LGSVRGCDRSLRSCSGLGSVVLDLGLAGSVGGAEGHAKDKAEEASAEKRCSGDETRGLPAAGRRDDEGEASDDEDGDVEGDDVLDLDLVLFLDDGIGGKDENERCD